jgi:hypothetical protein
MKNGTEASIVRLVAVACFTSHVIVDIVDDYESVIRQVFDRCTDILDPGIV